MLQSRPTHSESPTLKIPRSQNSSLATAQSSLSASTLTLPTAHAVQEMDRRRRRAEPSQAKHEELPPTL